MATNITRLRLQLHGLIYCHYHAFMMLPSHCGHKFSWKATVVREVREFDGPANHSDMSAQHDLATGEMTGKDCMLVH